MLPASRRVRRRADFAAALRGYRAGGPLVIVHVAVPSSSAVDGGAGTVRVGFIVNKAVGKAVARNAVKRRLRHLVATRLDAFPPGAVVVVRAGREAAAASSDQLAQALDAAISAVAQKALPAGARGARR
jgi:ribonuclease P protein component